MRSRRGTTIVLGNGARRPHGNSIAAGHFFQNPILSQYPSINRFYPPTRIPMREVRIYLRQRMLTGFEQSPGNPGTLIVKGRRQPDSSGGSGHRIDQCNARTLDRARFLPKAFCSSLGFVETRPVPDKHESIKAWRESKSDTSGSPMHWAERIATKILYLV